MGKEKVSYQVIFKAVEHALEMNEDMLFCSECKKGFFKVLMVDENQPDFLLVDKFIGDDGELYKCKDHLLYDLLIDPEVSEQIVINKTINKNSGRKIQVYLNKTDARLFLPDRMN